MNHNIINIRPYIVGVWLLIVCLLYPSSNYVNLPTIISVGEEKFWSDLSECTTGVASGSATVDGKPLLWKNRDCFDDNQEYRYVDNGPIPYIGLTYGWEPNDYYAGLNLAGFAIENSDAVNLDGNNPDQNGWGFDADDGEVMTLALATCTTVDDFEAILDSTNIDGRTGDSNFGVIDAFGGAAIFEADGYQYTRFDADEEESGFLIRANFSYSGSGGGEEYNGYSRHRHNRAMELWESAVDEHALTPQYVLQQVIRDLMLEGMDDYSMPYEGYWQQNGYGRIPNGTAICRSHTRSVLLVQGARQGQRSDDAILWAMGSNPIGVVATPLWVRAGSVPPEYDDDNNQQTRLCAVGTTRRNWATDFDGVDTYKLINPQGTGYWDYVFTLENYIFEKVDLFIRSPQFHYDRLAAFQNEIAQQMVDSLEGWRSCDRITEIVEPVIVDGYIVLAWGRVDYDPFGADRDPRGYIIYRSLHPFRQGHRGEQLSFTETNRYIDYNPPPQSAFYRVEVIF
ncbi:MAG: hypothetical protein P9M15_01220 [Candidatus Electryoneaceae bacterium]|nr:hypothetical protein [Candidatus Electryoneaceae bacterium]